MPIDFLLLDEKLKILHDNYGKITDIKEAYQKSLHTYEDESTIEWTVAQKQKALNEVKDLVIEVDLAVAVIKTILGIP